MLNVPTSFVHILCCTRKLELESTLYDKYRHFRGLIFLYKFLRPTYKNES